MRKKLLHLSNFILFIFFPALAFNQVGPTPYTVSMSAGTNNASAFGTEGTIASDGGVMTFYSHWDATYLYLGWSGGRTNYSSDMYYAAIDIDANATYGSTNAIEGVSFLSAANTRKPKFYVVYENNQNYYGAPVSNGNAFEIYDGSGGTWQFVSRTNGNDNVNSRIDFQDNNGEVRLRVPWSAIGFFPGDITFTPPLGLTMWTNNGNGDYMWSRFPAENPSTGNTPKTLAYSFLFYNTANGITPSSSFVTENNTFTTGSISGTQNLGLTISGNAASLSADATLNKNLNFIYGSSLNLNDHTLALNTVTGAPVFTGSSASSMVINAAANQSLNNPVLLYFDPASPSTRSLNNITLNGGRSAILNNALDIYGELKLNGASHLNFNSVPFTLKSNASGTARIAAITGGSTITGADKVTVERFIKLRSGGSGRAYRLLAPTVNTPSSTILDNWMEGQMNTAVGSNNIPPSPYQNFGTQITGAGGNTNYFDVTQTNASSLYFTNNAIVPTYTAVGTTGIPLNALTGYFLYIRGDRSMDMTLALAPGMPTSSTTLRATGTLLDGTGNVTSFTNPLIGSGALNLITNPFASPIDWSLVKPDCTNIADAYTFWDPNFGTRGGFVTVGTDGIPSSGAANKFIQSGQAFFVQSTGGIPTVSIKEIHKSAGNNNGVFGPTLATESFKTELYFTESNGFRRIADGVLVKYDNNYSAGIDDHDAMEINNWDENIAISRDGKHLAIESRPVIQQKDTIPLFMNNMKQMGYQFQFVPSNFTNTALKSELVDNFLGTRTSLSVTDTVVVPFTITANPASSATNRFEIVFAPLSTLAIDIITIKASLKNAGIQVEWTASAETDMDHYEVERSVDGVQFVKQTMVPATGNSNMPVNYSWFDASPQAGDEYYRIKAMDKNGRSKYSSIVKVSTGKSGPEITISPNPVSGKKFELQLTDMVKGTYILDLYNNLGQKVFSTSVQHNGGSSTKNIVLGNSLLSGAYQAVLTGEGNVRITKSIIKN